MRELIAARRRFVKEIKKRGKISSPRLLSAFAVTSREHFFDEGPWQLRSLVRIYCRTLDANPIHLYQDALVALDEDRGLDSGLPSLWAQLFDRLDIKEKERVVQVGCGTGYYSAILSQVVGPAGTVVAIDCKKALIERAQRNLRDYRNVEVVHCDGCQDVGGPADVIVVHAGFAHPHPLWLDSLRPHGRLMVPLTDHTRQGTLFKITRLDNGYQAEAVGGIEIIPGHGRGNTDDARLKRWWEAVPQVRSLRRDVHAEDHTCWLHDERFCFSTRIANGKGRIGHRRTAAPKSNKVRCQPVAVSNKR
jgi:protein-L-isoaspartate(D-aspartate) O-methyltransferase